MLSEMKALSPDIVCLTEAHAHSCDVLDGHVISTIGYGAHRKAQTERLVLLWSKAPWERLPVPEEIETAGGACFGITRIGEMEMACAWSLHSVSYVEV